MKRKIIIPLLAAAAILAVALAASNIGRGDVGQRHILVAYFSATGNTKAVAETTATVLHGDLFRIAAEEPYTDADLGHGESARVTREQADPNSRPAIKNRVENWEQYDTVVIGYPIWNGDAPRIVSTFVQSYDFTGKKVAVFCTSGSSGVEDSQEKLRGLLPGAEFRPGIRFDAAGRCPGLGSGGGHRIRRHFRLRKRPDGGIMRENKPRKEPV